MNGDATGDQDGRHRRARSEMRATRSQYSSGPGRDCPDLRAARLDRRRPELSVQLAAPHRDDPAGVGDRHHRRRRDPGHHHRRHRPVVRLGRRPDRDGGGEPRPELGLRPRRLSVPDRAAGVHPGPRRPARGHRGRAGQRQPDRHHRHPAVHRDARHDGDRARHRQMVHARPAGQHALRQLRRDRLRASGRW